MRDPEIIKAIVKMYEMTDERGKRVPVQDIRKEFDLNPADLYQILRDEGVPFRSEREGEGSRRARKVDRIYPDSVRETVVRLYKGPPRKTIMEVARLTSIPYQHVRTMLHDAHVGVVRGRPTIGETEALKGRLKRRLNANASIREAAALEGVTVGEAMELLELTEGPVAVGLMQEKVVADMVDETVRRVKVLLDLSEERE